MLADFNFIMKKSDVNDCSFGHLPNCYHTVKFWADSCSNKYDFIVVIGQIATSAFYKVVYQQY